MDLWVASSSKIAHRSGDSMTPSRETRVDSISLRTASPSYNPSLGACPKLGCGHSVWSLRADQRGLRLPDRGLGHRIGELVAPDEREDRRQGEQRDRAEHPECGLEAAGQRLGC